MTKGAQYSWQLLNSVENRGESEADLYRRPDVVSDAGPHRALHADCHIKSCEATRGGFDAVANLESVYATAQLVHQVSLCSHVGLPCASGRTTMLAIVVPTPLALAEYGNTPTLKETLHKSLVQIAATVGLQPCEVPVRVLVQAEPFTDDNVPLGDGGSHRRRFEERRGSSG